MKRPYLFVLAGLLVLALPLMAAGAELTDSPCYKCHQKQKDSLAKAAAVHDPVASGECDSCHQDHGDSNKLILTDEIPALCYGCHDQATKAAKHAPVEEGSCLDCHRVHGGEPKLLAKAVPDLCSDCHSESDHSGGKAPHDPVSGGECAECHQPHESDDKPLLTAKYSQERYLVYDAEAYTLCYNCHEKAAYEDPAAAGDTAFRNGETNLHYLHVVGKEEVNKYGIKKRKEGMTCMGCHQTHGSEQEKLIRVNLECGPTFCYTMNYRKFEGGGSCVVGCHKPKVYKVTTLNSATPSAPEAEKALPLAQQSPAPASGTTP